MFLSACTQRHGTVRARAAWCRVAWAEVCSGGLETIFAGELLQGVAPDSQEAPAASASGKLSENMSTTMSEAVDGMGDADSDAQSVIDMPAKGSAGQPHKPLWFLVRGAYVANTHVVGESSQLPVLCCL